jgi:hypothetical protein
MKQTPSSRALDTRITKSKTEKSTPFIHRSTFHLVLCIGPPPALLLSATCFAGQVQKGTNTALQWIHNAPIQQTRPPLLRSSQAICRHDNHEWTAVASEMLLRR